jgi:hypothetical protein
MSVTRDARVVCPHCGELVDGLAQHVGMFSCPAVEFEPRGVVGGIDPHRAEFRLTVHSISWDDVPALEDAVGPDQPDDSLDERRRLADELEQEGVFWD